MRADNHILVEDKVKEELIKRKISPRDTFNDVLKRILKLKNDKK